MQVDVMYVLQDLLGTMLLAMLAQWVPTKIGLAVLVVWNVQLALLLPVLELLLHPLVRTAYQDTILLDPNVTLAQGGHTNRLPEVVVAQHAHLDIQPLPPLQLPHHNAPNVMLAITQLVHPVQPVLLVVTKNQLEMAYVSRVLVI
jgi:hypothetical protein